MHRLLIPLLFFFTLSCTQPESQISTGIWRGAITIQGRELPFNFDIEQASGTYIAHIHNAEERILLDDITVMGDSILMTLHTFDATFKARVKGDSLVGRFVINYAAGYSLPFNAAYGQAYRFAFSDTLATVTDFSGKYDVQFFNENSTPKAMGIIKQKGNYATATFLTPTGDLRYIEGNVVNDTLWLSAFDGNHIFIFNATKSGDSTIVGRQWLGRSRNRKWDGKLNPNARPPESESLTYLKPGYERIDFAFPNVDSVMIRSDDERYKNKVVILQILGSWCPNCLDETRFLVDWYKENHERGVEIIGLAYEQKEEFGYASKRVKKMKEKLGIPYEVLVAGSSDNQKAAATLPALNQVIAFPTTIFIGKDGKVKHIHTGFAGPGTGEYYEEMKERFSQTVNELLSVKENER